MKGIITSLNIFLLIAIIFLLLGIMFFIFAFSGMAIAVPFTTKIFFILSGLCLLIGIIFYFLKKKVKIKIEEKPE